MKKENKLRAGITAVALTAGTVFGGAVFSETTEVEKEVIVNKTVNVPFEVVKEIEVEKEVFVNQTVEVPVDNGNLDLVLEHVFDNDGKVQYLTNDLDDDEVDQIVDRVVFMNEVKKMAVDAVKDELFDEVDKMVVSGEELDEDDLERLRVDDDDDEIEVLDVDFDDKDAEVQITGTFEQDDIEYEFEVTVEFKDGEFDELKDITVVKA